MQAVRALLSALLLSSIWLPLAVLSSAGCDARTTRGPDAVREADAGRDMAEVRIADLPPEAARTLALIRAGGPFPYRKDGSVFGNRERRLPARARGYYTEYTVPTPGSRDRGARRIVAGRGATGSPSTGGEYYYTADHYETFRRIRE